MPAIPVSAGFWGKLPTRGDFLSLGLSRGFTEPWDAWISAMLAASREDLGAGWGAAWSAAPAWRFCLRPKLCGPHAVIGLWLPSMDRMGRAYPITFAAEFTAALAPGPLAHAWLDAAEAAGRAALAEGLLPQTVATRLPELEADPDGTAPPAASWWWSEGSALLPADEMCLAGLPARAHFRAMLAGDAA